MKKIRKWEEIWRLFIEDYSQTTEQNLNKRPNKIIINNRKVYKIIA